MAEITDETPFPHDTAVAAEFASGPPLDPVSDANVPLWAKIITIATTTTHEVDADTVWEARYVVVTRARLDLESPTELKNVFDVEQNGIIHRVVDVQEREATFDCTSLHEFHQYTRGLDKACVGGAQAENANSLDDVPLQRLVIPLTCWSASTRQTAFDGGEEAKHVSRELGESMEEVPGGVPGSGFGADAVGRWIVDRVARESIDAMLGSGRTEGVTVDVVATLGLVLQGMNRWWTFMVFFHQIIQVFHRMLRAIDYMEIPTGVESGRPGAIQNLAFVGDRYLELLARIGACLDMFRRPQWNRHRFHQVTDQCKTNRSLYTPMIEAGMHRHLQFAPYDPKRVLPNPPGVLSDFGLSAHIEPMHRDIADLAEAILGFVMLWLHNRGHYRGLRDTVPILRRLAIPLGTLPNPVPRFFHIPVPITRRRQGILRSRQEMAAFQERLGYAWSRSQFFDLVFEGTEESGNIVARGLNDEQVKYWRLMQKIGIVVLEICFTKQFVPNTPTTFRKRNYTRLLQHTFRTQVWIGDAVRPTAIMRFLEQKCRNLGWTVTDALRMRIVELSMGAVVLDSDFQYGEAAWNLYNLFFGQTVIDLARAL